MENLADETDACMTKFDNADDDDNDTPKDHAGHV